FDVVAVLDNDVVAVGFGIARRRDPAVACGPYWRAAIRGVVYPAMGADSFEDGMQALRVEVGTDVTEVQRCLEEVLSHAPPFGCVVVGAAVFVLVAYCLDGVAAIGELCSQNGSIAYLLTI